MSTVPAVHVFLVLSRAARAVEENAIDSVAAVGLGLSDFAVLEVLLHKGSMPVNAIGKKVLLTSGSITTAIDRLESKQLVRRISDSGDRRSRIVELTPEGKALIEKAFAKHSADMEDTMAVLRQSERVELVRLLKKVGLWAASRAENREGRVR